MILNNKKRLALLTVLFFILTAFDQYTKYLADKKLKGKSPFVIIKDVFEFKYLDGGNKGMAWGLFQGKVNLFIIIAFLLMIVLIFYIIKINKIITDLKKLENTGFTIKKFIVLQFFLVLLTSGAAGNLIDRFVNGFVVDFIYFKLINFPIFNVADCYVTITEFVLIFMFIFIIKDKELDLLFKRNNPHRKDLIKTDE